MTVGPGQQAARADFRTVPYATGPGAPVTTAASFVTAAGEPGLGPARAPAPGGRSAHLARVADADAVPDRVERPHHGQGAVERDER
ncbi:hypothetical protein GCM10010294_48520 [Streptomyces griseoloalbus]|nr:hypothetical protein GCM10010294_48520 [Streptomyces griseoloalbus]